jgi:hypothetical protein
MAERLPARDELLGVSEFEEGGMPGWLFRVSMRQDDAASVKLPRTCGRRFSALRNGALSFHIWPTPGERHVRGPILDHAKRRRYHIVKLG